MDSSTRTSAVLQTRRRDAVLYATLNRPESGNALSLELIGCACRNSGSGWRPILRSGRSFSKAPGAFSAPAMT